MHNGDTEGGRRTAAAESHRSRLGRTATLVRGEVLMKDKLNIVLIGGGSTWCPGILKALTKHLDIFPLNRV